MLWSIGRPLFTIYWMQIVYQIQLLNFLQWKSTSDTLTFLVELSSVAYCKSLLFKIRGYHSSMKMDKALTFPGNYRIREGNTMNKSNRIAEKIRIKYIFGIFLGSPLLVFPAEGFGWAPAPCLYFLTPGPFWWVSSAPCPFWWIS